MTVDKPPLALWVQALSARAFGFSSWSMLVPQALMGVATVGLAYDLVRRPFGRAGRLRRRARARADADHRRDLAPQQPRRAARRCAASPRCGASCAALEDGRTRWLVLCRRRRRPRLRGEDGRGAAWSCRRIAAAWLWVAPRGRLARGAPAAGRRRGDGRVGLAWPVLVWLTPGGRPAVGVGHERQQHLVADPRLQRPRPAVRPGRRAGGGGAGGGAAGGGGVFGGDAGRAAAAQREPRRAGRLAARLRASSRGSALLVATRLRRADARTGWLDRRRRRRSRRSPWRSARPQGIFHPYYVSQLAPFTAALVGGGVGRAARAAAWPRASLAPLAIGGGRGRRARRPGRQPGPLAGCPAVLVAGGVAAAVALAARRSAARLRAARSPRRSGCCCSRPATLGGADARPRDERDVPRGRPGVGRRRWAAAGRRRHRAAAASAAARPGPAPLAGARRRAGTRPRRAAAAGCSAATAVADRRRSPTPRPTAAGRSPSPASPAPPASSSPRAPTSPRSAASRAARARSASTGSPTRVEDGRIRWVLTDGGGGGMRSDGRVGSSDGHGRRRSRSASPSTRSTASTTCRARPTRCAPRCDKELRASPRRTAATPGGRTS